MRRERVTGDGVAGSAGPYPGEPVAGRPGTVMEGAHEHPVGERREYDDIRTTWEGRSRIVLLPTAAPSILGLFGFAGATMMVGAWQAGWYGDAKTGFIIFPFCATFGGLAQFLAGMWSYRARDGLATAMHGMWGAFWLAFGLLFGLGAVGLLPISKFGAVAPAFAFWFVVLGIITLCGFLASLAENLGLATVLGTLAAGSALTAVGWFLGSKGWLMVGGWLFVVSAAAAVYTAAALMMRGTYGRVILPLGEYSKNKNIPGRIPAYPIEYEHGMPGAKAGQ